MFDVRTALGKTMTRVARKLTPGLRASCDAQEWPNEDARKMSMRLRKGDCLWYADYKGTDAQPALDLEYGDGDEPPKPGIYNYIESKDEMKRAGKLLKQDAREFVDEINRLVSRL